LKLLEMQRNALLMYTSCGWFFDDVSGIETVQVLQYAGRALQLAEELAGRPLGAAFLKRLAPGKSNVPGAQGGRAGVREVRAAGAGGPGQGRGALRGQLALRELPRAAAAVQLHGRGRGGESRRGRQGPAGDGAGAGGVGGDGRVGGVRLRGGALRR